MAGYTIWNENLSDRSVLMPKKNLLLILGLLMVVALVAVTFPTATRAQQDVSENFIFVNYIGQEITLDLDDVTYVVPGTDTAPEGGRLGLQLAVGEHKYAANVPGVAGGAAGEFTIVPGGFVAKAARLENSGYIVDRNGIVIDHPQDYVYVFDFDPFAAPIVEEPLVDTWQPAAAASGLGSVVWINYYGSDELTIDLAGELYKVPPQIDDIPGRLQIDLSPGPHRYTISVPNGSLNGEINVVAGQVTGLSITADIPIQEKYDVGDEFEFHPPVTLHLAEEDLTSQVSIPEADAAPDVLPVTGGEIVPHQVNPQGLLLKNYAGDTLIFTINSQTYTIANNAEQTLILPPGQYSYTASLPFVATSGVVDLAVEQNIEMSIVLNVEGRSLTVYQ
jgi:hypothetical protein